MIHLTDINKRLAKGQAVFLQSKMYRLKLPTVRFLESSATAGQEKVR